MSPTPSLLSVNSAHSNQEPRVGNKSVASYNTKEIDHRIKNWLVQHVEQVSQRTALDAHRPRSPTQNRVIEYFFHGTEALCAISISSLGMNPSKYASIYDLTGMFNAVNMAADSLSRGDNSTAVQHYEKSQSLFSEMLSNSNPWLLVAAFHFCVLFTAMEPVSPAIMSFMAFMSGLAANAAPQHPFATMMNVALRGLANRETLQMTLHRVSDCLSQSFARCHDLSYYVVRYRTSQLEHLGFYHNAAKTLYEDLAWVPRHFGETSIQNLSRLFQLACCLYRAGNTDAAIHEIDSLIVFLSVSSLSQQDNCEFEEHISLCPLPDAYKRPLQQCCKSQAQAGAASIRCWLAHPDHAVLPHSSYAYALLNWLEKQDIQGFY